MTLSRRIGDSPGPLIFIGQGAVIWMFLALRAGYGRPDRIGAADGLSVNDLKTRPVAPPASLLLPAGSRRHGLFSGWAKSYFNIAHSWGPFNDRLTFFRLSVARARGSRRYSA